MLVQNNITRTFCSKNLQISKNLQKRKIKVNSNCFLSIKYIFCCYRKEIKKTLILTIILYFKEKFTFMQYRNIRKTYIARRLIRESYCNKSNIQHCFFL